MTPSTASTSQESNTDSVLDGDPTAVATTFVVVGVDGSLGSQRALDWAAEKADVFGPVKPVAAFHVDPLADGVGIPALYQDLPKLMAEDATANLVHSLQASHPDLLERSQVVKGYAGPALVRASTGERLLVVGSRGRSALAETLLGSVTSYCVKHAAVPVAVIPEDTPVDEPLDHIVVGVDGSENSTEALRWAVDHVAEGGRITAMTAWMPGPWGMELVPPVPEMGADARRTVQRMVDVVLDEGDAASVGGPPVDRPFTVAIEAVMGDARNVLRKAAKEADLLVIGARGHQGAAYLLLGSVASSLVHHPTAATVVVPAAR